MILAIVDCFERMFIFLEDDVHLCIMSSVQYQFSSAAGVVVDLRCYSWAADVRDVVFPRRDAAEEMVHTRHFCCPLKLRRLSSF